MKVYKSNGFTSGLGIYMLLCPYYRYLDISHIHNVQSVVNVVKMEGEQTAVEGAFPIHTCV